MALVEKHISQWKHNRSFVATIRPPFPDWIITACFYTALHAVDTLLAFDGENPTNHESRNNALRRTNSYQFLWKHYRPLYDLSRTMRYFADRTTWLAHRDISNRILSGRLYPIEKFVEGRLSRALEFGADHAIELGNGPGDLTRSAVPLSGTPIAWP